MRRGLVAIWLLSLFFLGIGISGCRQGVDVDSAEKEEAVPVTLATVTKGRLSEGDILSGVVAAGAEVSVVPKIAGKVAMVAVDVGSQVKAGQVVLRLDAPELAAAVRQAEAALALAQSGLRQAELDYTVAAASYERGKFLLEQGALPEAEFEAKYELPYRSAKERVEKLAPAQVAQAEAALALAEANLANTVLTAPLDGTVTARGVDPGEMASPAAPVLTIADLDPVMVEAEASEWQVNRLAVGQEVRVFVAAARAEPFTGVISSLSPAADPRTKSYRLKVRLANPHRLVKPGMFARVDLGVTEEVVLVPRDAVVSRKETAVVFLVEKDRAVLRRVQTGASDGRNIVITEGLEPGESIVVSGQERLTDGCKVCVVKSQG